MQKLTIWTDGSCSPNPGTGGWAAIIVNGNDQRELFGGEKQSTNNRMELTAIISALQVIDEPSDITIMTDSELTLNCAVGNWKRKKNRDLWQQYDDLSKPHDIIFEKVKAHVGIDLNERADELANQGRLMVTGEVIS